MELFLYYLLLNILLFGSLYAIGKLVEKSYWVIIENNEHYLYMIKKLEEKI